MGVFLACAAAILVLDQASKDLAASHLLLGQPVPILVGPRRALRFRASDLLP